MCSEENYFYVYKNPEKNKTKTKPYQAPEKLTFLLSHVQ